MQQRTVPAPVMVMALVVCSSASTADDRGVGGILACATNHTYTNTNNNRTHITSEVSDPVKTHRAHWQAHFVGRLRWLVGCLLAPLHNHTHPLTPIHTYINGGQVYSYPGQRASLVGVAANLTWCINIVLLFGTGRRARI